MLKYFTKHKITISLILNCYFQLYCSKYLQHMTDIESLTYGLNIVSRVKMAAT